MMFVVYEIKPTYHIGRTGLKHKSVRLIEDAETKINEKRITNYNTIKTCSDCSDEYLFKILKPKGDFLEH